MPSVDRRYAALASLGTAASSVWVQARGGGHRDDDSRQPGHRVDSTLIRRTSLIDP
jgi:hypothetical protein